MTQQIMSDRYRPDGRASGDASIVDLIAPALRRAFPLPSEQGPGEERFLRLLDALAQRRSDALLQ